MPTIDGILMREAKHLTYRNAKPGDTNYLGEEIEDGKIVFVPKEDAKELDDGTLDPHTADPIPQIHPPDAKRRAYGEWKHQRKRDPQWIEGEKLKKYYTCPVYLMREGKVLMGTIYSKNDPRVEDLKKITEEKKEQQDEAESQPQA